MSTAKPNESGPYAVEVFSKLEQEKGVTPHIPIDAIARAHRFHYAFGMTIGKSWGDCPTVTERILRGKLLWEEVKETFKAMGLTLCDSAYDDNQIDRLEIQHVEGSFYDPIETADGLADIGVICAGTAVSFGIPLSLVDAEVYASNMTKLPPDGKPIVNQCNNGSCGDDPRMCEDQSHLIDPTSYAGKVLKPATYTPANIKRLYAAHVDPKSENNDGI